jgi:hypothetical protein
MKEVYFCPDKKGKKLHQNRYNKHPGKTGKPAVRDALNRMPDELDDDGFQGIRRNHDCQNVIEDGA